MFSVKGSSISSKFDFLRETFGSAAELELRESLRGEADLGTILDSSQYPFDLYDRILVAIAERFYDGDLSRLEEVGAYSAQKSLTTIYRAFTQGKDFFGFLSRIGLLHERFYSAGKMEVEVAPDRQSARIHLSGAPRYSDADLFVAGGFYTGPGKLLGHEGIKYVLARTDDGATFQLKW